MEEKGIDPTKALQLSDDEITAFNLRLNDGTTGQAFIYDLNDGYFSLGCVNAVQSLQPLNILAWYMATGKHDLLASAETHNKDYCGMAALRTKPQSAEELRQELDVFVTRVGMAVEAFRTVTHASQKENSPD